MRHNPWNVKKEIEKGIIKPVWNVKLQVEKYCEAKNIKMIGSTKSDMTTDKKTILNVLW